MKLAVMQPYFYPYIGYFQLLNAVDEFVCFDDVKFIKKGFINRNNILLGGASHQFSIPVSGVSQNRNICEHMYAGQFTDFLKMLNSAYSRAPYFKDIFPIIENICLDSEMSVSIKNRRALEGILSYLGMSKVIRDSSMLEIDPEIKGQERILAICEVLGADTYINAIGGKELYHRPAFQEKGIELNFIRPQLNEYKQYTGPFVPGLSILDVLMFNDVGSVRAMLNGGSLE